MASLTWFGHAVAVFVALFILDFFWTRYTAAVTARAATPAGIYSAGIVLANGVAVLIYADNPVMVLPAALGAFCGTWFAVKRG